VGGTTIGVDLAASSPGTATATLAWGEGRAVVTDVAVGVDDAGLLALLRAGAAKVGIDCPVGWPSAFVETVSRHHVDDLPADLATEPGWKVPLVNRATDLHVREQLGMIPLSVAADLIGHAALRCAAVLAQARVRGVDVARDGSGAIAEVYPAAALKVWGLPHRGYKGRANAAARDALVDALLLAAPWLDLGSHEATVRRTDHALDAVVCALVARAVVRGATAPPTTRAAAREGWIHYPTAPLAALP
jgi:hypothetical protein